MLDMQDFLTHFAFWPQGQLFDAQSSEQVAPQSSQRQLALDASINLGFHLFANPLHASRTDQEKVRSNQQEAQHHDLEESFSIHRGFSMDDGQLKFFGRALIVVSAII